MNTQRHSVTKKSPYEVVFGQRIFGTRIPFIERGEQTVEDETLQDDLIGNMVIGDQSIASGVDRDRTSVDPSLEPSLISIESDHTPVRTVLSALNVSI